MMHYECIVYGVRGLLWGLPASIVFAYASWSVARSVVYVDFFIPISSVLVAAISVFLVVFISMTYASRKLEAENLAEAIRTEAF